MQLMKGYDNFFLGQPYTISDYWCKYVLSTVRWTTKEKSAELPCTLR